MYRVGEEDEVCRRNYIGFMVKGSRSNFGSWFKVNDSWLLPTNMAYEKKEYKKRIEGCHNL